MSTSLVHSIMNLKGLGVFGILTWFCLIKVGTTDHMEGFIVGGNTSVIKDFPHVAFLHIKCKKHVSTFCGASIINQVLLLTAAHCVITCKGIRNFSIKAYTGSVTKYKGQRSKVIGFRMHEHYIHHNFTNDIAMLILNDNLKFGKNVQRILIPKRAPEYVIAKIAGWGWIDDQSKRTNTLMYTSQNILSYKECIINLPGIPQGTICGFNPCTAHPHPQRGDSGSALVVDKYVQIGIASYFRRQYSNDTLVYTNVTYFYDWIRLTAQDMFCEFKKRKLLLKQEKTTSLDEDYKKDKEKVTEDMKKEVTQENSKDLLGDSIDL